MSATDANPSVLFPGTTWTQLKDRFLLGAGDTYTNGTTAGSATINYTPAGNVGNHTLTEAEMPAHTHTFTGTTTDSTGVNQWHQHLGYARYEYIPGGGSQKGYLVGEGDGTFNTSNAVVMGSGSHSHNFSVWSGTENVNHTHQHLPEGTNSTTGSGTAHNHGFTGTQATLSTMSPYLVVYIWKRTA